MAVLPTNLGTKYARNVLKKYYGKAVTPVITNQNYEGDLKAGGASSLKILSFLNSVTLSNYTSGSNMSTEQWMGDVETTLSPNQQKYWNFAIDDVDKFEAYVNDIDSNLLNDAAGVLMQTIDTYVLGLHTHSKVGHRIGSDLDSDGAVEGAVIGQATVTTGTGATTVAAGTSSATYNYMQGGAIIGLGIKFDGSATWYKISAFTSSLSFTITDWNDSTYTGGTKTSVEFVLEAIYPKIVTSTTVYGDICELKEMLGKDNIPSEDRWLVVPPEITTLLIQSSSLTPAVAAAYEDVVLNGLIGKVAGFKVYESNYVAGSSTKGWHCLAGHKSAITFAHAFARSRVVDAESQFATKYQGLHLYGAAVPIERRKALAEAFWAIDPGCDDYAG